MNIGTNAGRGPCPRPTLWVKRYDTYDLEGLIALLMLVVAHSGPFMVNGIAHFVLFIRTLREDEIIDHLGTLIPVTEPVLRLIHSD